VRRFRTTRPALDSAVDYVEDLRVCACVITHSYSSTAILALQLYFVVASAAPLGRERRRCPSILLVQVLSMVSRPVVRGGAWNEAARLPRCESVARVKTLIAVIFSDTR